MKLSIRESNNNGNFIIYIDMLPFLDVKGNIQLNEDDIQPNHVFSKDKKYENEFDTRQYILAKYIATFAKRLVEEFDFVIDYDAHSSSEGNYGLSNYLTLTFEHPDNITESELEETYMYTIRFSDHENKHPELGVVEEVDMTDMKASNLMKAGMRVFKRKLSDVQRDIARFEIEKFGEQQTFSTCEYYTKICRFYLADFSLLFLKILLTNYIFHDILYLRVFP